MLCLQRIREFRAPPESLEKTLENNRPKRRYGQTTMGQEEGAVGGVEDGSAAYHMGREDLAEGVSSPSTGNNSFVLCGGGGERWGSHFTFFCIAMAGPVHVCELGLDS